MTTPPPPSNEDAPDEDLAPAADPNAGWDAFWAEVEAEEAAEQGKAPTETIRGVTVVVPHDMPLKFSRELERLQGSSSDEDVRELLIKLFGADVFDQWIENGMMTLEFKVVLAWGIARTQGNPLSFRKAYELIRGQGKDPAPKTGPVPPGAKRGSGGSGRSSRRTSTANTSSGRGTSRT